MFDHFPLFRGKYLTYQEYFAIYGVLVAVGLWLFFFALSKSYHLSSLWRRYQQSRAREASREIQLSLNEKQSPPPTTTKGSASQMSGMNISDTKPSKSLSSDLSNHLIFRIFRWISFIMFSTGFIVLSSLDVIPVPLSIFLVLHFLGFFLFKDLISLYLAENESNNTITSKAQILQDSLHARPLTFVISAGLIVFYSLFLQLAFSGTCVALHNDAAPFGIVNTKFSINTKMMRSMYGDSCPPGPPCHFFAILPENSSSTVLVHLHTNNEIESIHFALNGSSNQEFISDQQVYKIRNIEKGGQRNIHIVLVDGLLPDTYYNFTVSYNGFLQANYTYLTMPLNTSSRNLTMVMGGDVGANARHNKMSDIAAKYSPDLIVIGGDLAYDNNIKSCYYTWDGFLQPLELIGQRIGRLIPFIFSIGNHEVGLNDYSGRKMPIDEDGPLYFSWFAQNTILNQTKKTIPSPSQRTAYQYHIIADTLLFSLDTGYVVPMEGPQTNFIANVSSQHPDMRKIAIYHKPMYSPCVAKDLNRTEMLEGRSAFLGSFDKYKFKLAMENHQHIFKRTKPIKNGKEDASGTVYLGEGCWGVSASKCNAINRTGLIEKMDNSLNNFWILTVKSTEITARAFDQQGEVVDQTIIY